LQTNRSRSRKITKLYKVAHALRIFFGSEMASVNRLSSASPQLDANEDGEKTDRSNILLPLE
jgi:hypothetical protein